MGYTGFKSPGPSTALVSGSVRSRHRAADRMALGQLLQGWLDPGLMAGIAGRSHNAALQAANVEIDPVASQSVSNKSCIRKTARREEAVAAPLDVVERPLRLRKTGKSPPVKSVWSSLRDLCTGKKIIRNSFAFKMSSARDQRGIMAIPIRHDGNFGLVDSGADQDWTVGSQSMVTHPDGTGGGGDGYGEYETMLRTPKMQTWDVEAAPNNNASNIFVPRLNLPTLEQTSWDLNAMKIYPTDNLLVAQQAILQDSSNTFMTSPSLLAPVMQLGGSAVPYNGNNSQFTNDLPNGYPAPKNSWARRQQAGVYSGDPYAASSVGGTKHFDALPRFKTQLGGGTLKMRIANQGTNQVTVEFVVLKVKDVLQGKVSSDQLPDQDAGITANMTKFWRNMWASVGDRYYRKTTANLSYHMGEDEPSVSKLMYDPLINPYKAWLPDSYFMSKYTGQTNAVPYGPGLKSSTLPGGIPTGNVQYTLGNVGQQGGGEMFSGGDTRVASEGVQFTPKYDADDFPPGAPTHYRPVSRGHCTISAAGERTVTIPIPGSMYNAAELQQGQWSMDYNKVIDGSHVLPMTDESYVVCMSVNGSLQDFIEPNQNTDDTSVRVTGKAYTGAIIDCHCEYKETVYPSYCDYSAITPMAYNIGNVRSAQVIPLTNSKGFSGKVLPMSAAVPTCTTGVLRTGVVDRGGQNEGDN